MTFVEERDKAFTDAVVNDNWNGVRAFTEKYGISASSDTVMKAGIYKAVQYCTDIPEDVNAHCVHSKCLTHLNTMIPIFARNTWGVYFCSLNHKWITIEKECSFSCLKSARLLCCDWLA